MPHWLRTIKPTATVYRPLENAGCLASKRVMNYRVLLDACRDGRGLDIIYHGGSQPGAKRTIVPLKLLATKLVAIDPSSDRVKHYRIEKIELPSEPDSSPLYDVHAADEACAIDGLSIRQMAEAMADELASLGWHVTLREDAIELSRFFKNGRPKKGFELYIGFVPFVTNSFFDLDKGDFVEEVRPSIRPWRVLLPGSGQKCFSRLSSAWTVFYREAQSHSPLSSEG